MFDFAGRRRRFLERCGGVAAILPGAHVRRRTRDTEHRFRQDSDFYYLTGFPEPDAVAFLDAARFILFLRPRDPEREAWEGRRAGVEDAGEYGAAGRPLEELEGFLNQELKSAARISLPLGRSQFLDAWLSRHLAFRAGSPAPEIFDPSVIIGEMRLYKEPEEIRRMETAARITAAAHEEAARILAPGLQEYEVEALIEYAFRRAGASGPAYPSIVGSGENAAILHYTKNDRRMERDDLVLIDAGCEFEMYAADVTRTWAVSGTLSRDQRTIHELVSQAQAEAIARCRPGNTFDDVHSAAQRILAKGLADLRILDGTVDEILKQDRQKPFTIHKTSHWLGLDVHDAGSHTVNGESRLLEPGMVLTVEPGLYFRAGCAAPENFRGIGVRIEDDVLITPGAPKILSRLQ